MRWKVMANVSTSLRSCLVQSFCRSYSVLLPIIFHVKSSIFNLLNHVPLFTTFDTSNDLSKPIERFVPVISTQLFI